MTTLTEPWVYAWPQSVAAGDIGRAAGRRSVRRGRAADRPRRSPAARSSGRPRSPSSPTTCPIAPPPTAARGPTRPTVEVPATVAQRVLRGVAAHPGRLPARRRRLLRRACRRVPIRRARCWCSPPTPGTPTTTSAAATSTRRGTQVSFARPMAPGFLRKPDGPGEPGGRRRRARTGPCAPTSPTCATTSSRSGPVRPAGPTPSSRSCSGPRPRATSSTTPSTPTSRRCPGCSTVAASTCRSATTSTGRGRCATRSSSSSPAGGNAAFLSGNTSFWQVRFEDDESMTATRTSSPRTRCTTPTASTCSRRCGPTT